MVVPLDSGCLLNNTVRQSSTLRVPSPSQDTPELSNHTSGFGLPASHESVTSYLQEITTISKGDQESQWRVLEVAWFLFG